MDADELGDMLEHKGMSDDDIDSYFEHAGVKGMKWGQRKQRRMQNNFDRLARVRDGKASKGDRLLALNNNLTFTKKQAGMQLRNSARLQKRVATGEAFVSKLMTKKEKIRLADFDFHQN